MLFTSSCCWVKIWHHSCLLFFFTSSFLLSDSLQQTGSGPGTRHRWLTLWKVCMRPHVVCLLLSFRPVSLCLSVITFWWLFYCNIVFQCRTWDSWVLLESFENSICNLLETKKCDKTNKPISQKWIGVFLTKERLCVVCLRGDKESWIRSKYVEKKFIHKLPETGRNTLLRRSSARRNRTTTHDCSMQQRPPLKPKPNRATLPRLTGRRDGETHSICWVTVPEWRKRRRKEKCDCLSVYVRVESQRHPEDPR